MLRGPFWCTVGRRRTLIKCYVISFLTDQQRSWTTKLLSKVQSENQTHWSGNRLRKPNSSKITLVTVAITPNLTPPSSLPSFPISKTCASIGKIEVLLEGIYWNLHKSFVRNLSHFLTQVRLFDGRSTGDGSIYTTMRHEYGIKEEQFHTFLSKVLLLLPFTYDHYSSMFSGLLLIEMHSSFVLSSSNPHLTCAGNPNVSSQSRLSITL